MQMQVECKEKKKEYIFPSPCCEKGQLSSTRGARRATSFERQTVETKFVGKQFSAHNDILPSIAYGEGWVP